MGTLYIIGTPIGNLNDITLRALEALKEVQTIFAEDTRVTKKLLSHYKIQKNVERYDEYANPAFYDETLQRLQRGESLALVTDAGTPGISDPGGRLVAYVVKHLPDAKIIPIPGPSAVTTALSASGLNADKFVFLGYPPHKKGRQTFFKNLKNFSISPIVFYESSHRLEKALKSLCEVFGEDKEIIVAHELTKIHEEIVHATTKNALEYFQGERKKGEFVIMLPEA